MRQVAVRPLTEGGLLVALMIIMGLIGMYVPMLGMFVLFIVAMPIVVLGARHGLRWSALGTAAASLGMGMLLSPQHALTVAIHYGIPGIAIGYCLEKRYSPGKTMLWGTVATVLSTLLMMQIAALLMGLNMMDEMIKSMNMVREMQQAMLLEGPFAMTAKPEMAQEMLAQMEQSFRITMLLLPALVLLMSVFMTYINYIAARLLLRRLGWVVEDFSPFKHWDMPIHCLNFFTAALVLLYWGSQSGNELIFKLGCNGALLAAVPLLVQGLSVFYYFADKYNLSRWLRRIILLMIFLNGIYMGLTVAIGVIDKMFDFRRLRAPQSGK